MSILTAPAIAYLCLQLFGRQSIGLVAGLAFAVLPTSFRLGGVLYAEALGAFLLVVGLILCTAEGPRISLRAFAAGVVFGYAALTRPYLLLTGLGPAVWLMKRSSRAAACLLTAMFIVLAPWVLRNAHRIGAVTLTTQTEDLWLGNNAWARGSFNGDLAAQDAYLAVKYPTFASLNELKRSLLYMSEALTEIADNPTRIVWLLPRKALLFFSPSSYLGFDWIYAILLPFALIGTLELLIREHSRSILWLAGYPIVAVLIICVVVYGEPRIRHPVDTLIVSLASVGIYCAARRLLSSAE